MTQKTAHTAKTCLGKIPYTILFIAIAVMLLQTTAQAQVGPTGEDRITDLWSLPQAPLYAQALQTSSHDWLGLNEDGFSGIFSSLYTDEYNCKVLLEARGPGCLYNMWFTLIEFADRLLIWIDGDLVIDRPIMDLFDSAREPFLWPVVGNSFQSSGGYYSYVPIPFNESIKVAVTGKPHFHHMLYHLYPTGTEVQPFTEDYDVGPLQQILDPGLLGKDPKPDRTTSILNGSAQIEPGSAIDLLDQQGAGYVAAVRIVVEGNPLQALHDLGLRAWFDGAQDPQIDVRLSALTGASDTWDGAGSMFVGLYDDPQKGRTAYIYFPMPYFRAAEFELRNHGTQPVNIDYEIELAQQQPPIDALTFHAVQLEENPTSLGSDYIVLDAPGRGIDLGQVQTMIGPQRRHLEGDERIYIDRSRWPAIYGTGTEDYYQGGWYFALGPFNLPFHGNPNHIRWDESDQTTCYRLHVSDALPFRDGVLHGIEHDMFNVYGDEQYSSVAFYYGIPDPARIRRDEIDIADELSEGLHNARFEISWDWVDSPMFTEGDRDLVPISDNGRRTWGYEQWTAYIHPDNDGLILRRLADMGIPQQQAVVSVDGERAGIWYQPRHNPFKRWIEDEFFLGPELTRGKREVRIRLDVISENENGWTSHRYWIDTLHLEAPSRMDEFKFTAGDPLMCPGGKTEFQVTGTDWLNDASEVTGLCVWTSSDLEVAVVNDGIVHALSPGKAEIACWIGDSPRAAVEVTVQSCADDDDDDDVSDDDDDEEVDREEENGKQNCCGYEE